MDSANAARRLDSFVVQDRDDPQDRPTDGVESAESTGWDPYEVWRTRVFLPRMERTAEKRIKPV